MTGTDIKRAVYNLTKDRNWAPDSTASDDLIKDWMMLVVEEFSPEAIENAVDALVAIQAGEHYELPVDFAAIENYEVHNNNGDIMEVRKPVDLVFTGDGQVIFPIDIPFGRMNYFPIPVFEDVSDDIPLNRMFHRCIVYFFYAQYYYQSGEGDHEEHKIADSYMYRFEMMKEHRYNTFLNKVSNSEPIATIDVLPGSKNRRSRRGDIDG